MSITLIAVLVIIAVLAIIAVGSYNRLVSLRQNVRESWADIDTELRRRYDLIPNLVESVKGYMSHESGTLEAVIAARNAAANTAAKGADAAEAVGNSDAALTGSLRQLFALSENYPQLRAVEGFTNLQSQLAESETRLAQARRFYNANVRELNTAVESFPTSLIAGSGGFHLASFFEIAEGDVARAPVAVKF